MRRFSFTLTLLAVLLTLAACGGGAKETPATSPAQPAAATQAPPAGTARAPEAPKPTTTTEAAATKAPEAAPTAAAEEALPVPKPSTLKSYVARIELKSEVTEPEPGLEAWNVIQMTYRLEPEPVAYRMLMTDKTGQGNQDVEMIAIGQDMYIKDPEGDTWTKLPATAGFGDVLQMIIDPEELTRDAPTDIFTPVNVVSRNEVIDGVATTHYRATEAQMRALIAKSQAQTGQEQKIISAAADFWVAKKGDYLKQYRTEMVHENADGRQIKTVTQMLITDENKPVTIEPPPADKVTEMGGLFPDETPEPEPSAAPASPETTAALAALPAPPESEEYKPAELPEGTRFVVQIIAAQGPVRVFLSEATVEEISAFYKVEMPKLGYQAGLQMPGEAGLVFSMYQKGDQIVIIQVGEDSASRKRIVILQMP